jgi:hypothetical protein
MSASRTFSAPVALVGPRARGRGYGVLRQSENVRLTPAAEARLNDFALALAGWADRRLEGFVALFPLASDVSALVRARYFGEAELGSVALATVVLLDPALLKALDGRAHRLLPNVPEPDAKTTGADPMPVEAPASAPEPHPLTGALDLAWRDRTVDAGECAPEAVLTSLLETIDPAAQRHRITGWVTTGSLPHAGEFQPAQLFNLVVHAPADALALKAFSHPSAQVRGGAISAEIGPPPDPWTLWAAFKALRTGDAAADVALDAARWDPRYASLAPGAVVAIGALETCLSLTPAQRLSLITAMAKASATRDGLVGEGLARGLAETLERLAAGSASPEVAAYYIGGVLAAIDPERLGAAHGLGSVAALPGVLAWIEPHQAAALTRLGLVSALGARLLNDATAIANVREATLQALLAPALAAASEPSGRALATAVLAQSAEEHADPALEQALSTLLALPPSPLDSRLATAGVVRLAMRGGGALTPVLIRRVLIPALRAPEAPSGFVQALQAALVAEREMRAA